MSRDVDEDLIEATIRRIEAQKAAQGQDGAPPPAADEAEPQEAGDGELAPLPAPDESAIEATIRRIEAEKAARAAEPEEDAGAPDVVDESVVEATIRRVEAEKAARAEEVDDAQDPPPPADESAIEATIRRIEAEKAARASSAGVSDAPTAAVPSAPAEDAHEAPVPISAARPRTTAPDEAEDEDRITALERQLADVRTTLSSVMARLDQLTLSLTAGGGSAPAARRGTQTQTDWSGNPAVTNVLRDAQPSSRGALAEQLQQEPAAIDTRPLPKPLPPLQVESKRGLDLLPRAYRITVEDKRRGVDLVPLHRALLSMDGVRDMSLLSYNNGIAIVSLETTGEIDPDDLGAHVSRAMSRGAKVEVHNEHTLVVKLSED